MARIHLSRSEAENGDLPAICMRCGRPAVAWQSKRLAWKPSWVNFFLFYGLPLYFILKRDLEKQCSLLAPVCQKHAKRWGFPGFLGWMFFLGLVFVGLCSVLLTLKTCKGAVETTLADLSFAGTLIGFFAWLYLFLLGREAPMEPTEITDQTITLMCVSEAFAIALEQHRKKMPPPDLHDDIGQPFLPDTRPANDHYHSADLPR